MVEATIMSATVFSGTAQMAVLQMWQTTLSLLPVFFTVLMMNTRYILMGAALRPWLGTLPTGKAALSLFFLVDGSFVLAMREKAKGNDDGAVLLGSGVVSYAGWVVATVVGYADRPQAGRSAPLRPRYHPGAVLRVVRRLHVARAGRSWRRRRARPRRPSSSTGWAAARGRSRWRAWSAR